MPRLLLLGWLAVHVPAACSVAQQYAAGHRVSGLVFLISSWFESAVGVAG